MGKITARRRTKAALPEAEVKLPLKHCPECCAKLALDFYCGKYIVMYCAACDTYFRHFPSEPLTSWKGDEDVDDGEEQVSEVRPSGDQ